MRTGGRGMEYLGRRCLLSRTNFGDEAQAYLVDAGGHIIAHPDAELVASFADMSTSPSVAAFLNNPASSGSLRDAGPGGALLSSYARVPDLRWGVIVERPTTAALAATRAQLDLLFLLGPSMQHCREERVFR